MVHTLSPSMILLPPRIHCHDPPSQDPIVNSQNPTAPSLKKGRKRLSSAAAERIKNSGARREQWGATVDQQWRRGHV